MSFIKVTILIFFFFALPSCLNSTCSNPLELKVLALNTWGMPKLFGSEDKEARMEDIGEFIQRKDFDLYLLSELWMRPDHETIKLYLPEDYFMTEYSQFADSGCDGRVSPFQCSGLAIVSRFPLDQVDFVKYSTGGEGTETLAAKGIGRVRITVIKNIDQNFMKQKIDQSFIVDVFVTHTAADESSVSNELARQEQVGQLIKLIDLSEADFVVLGGDLNVDPRMPENSYRKLREVLVDTRQDVCEWFWKEELCNLSPKTATYDNPENTYTKTEFWAVYDYIFHKARDDNWIETALFQVPLLKRNNRSFSDHEGVAAHLRLCKPEGMDSKGKRRTPKRSDPEDSVVNLNLWI